MSKNSQFIKSITHGEVERVKEFLLDEKININEANEDGLTPLMLACLNNQFEIVKLLIHANANLDVKDLADWSAISYSMFIGSAEIAILLINAGADYSEIENKEEFLAFTEVKTFIDTIKEKEFLKAYHVSTFKIN
jgi:ankyrin repeat protein